MIFEKEGIFLGTARTGKHAARLVVNHPQYNGASFFRHFRPLVLLVDVCKASIAQEPERLKTVKQ